MRVHVVGGGLAGLSAALTLAEAGRAVTLHEAGPACGGRCRSYFDRALGVRIDNGNHLLLSGNRETFAYLRRLGTEDTLGGPARPDFPFVDVATGERWVLALGRGPIPWWLLRAATRVPGTSLRDYAALVRLFRAGPGATVADCIPDGALSERLVTPLAIAILNTMPDRGSAALLAGVFRQSLLRGGGACIPAFPREGLSETFVDPAVARLAARGAEIRLSARIAGLTQEGGRVVGLAGANGTETLGAADEVVLAVPAPVASGLLPGLATPEDYESIVNVHFRTDLGPRHGEVAAAGFVGLTGGSLAEWVFVKPGVVSVTISAANRFATMPNEMIVARAWDEVVVSLALRRGTEMPPHRLIREKRATFEATPLQSKRRSDVRDAAANVALAGDWTATGLPATIEGAIKSGRTAAEVVLSAPDVARVHGRSVAGSGRQLMKDPGD